jgi:hypothetical protein
MVGVYQRWVENHVFELAPWLAQLRTLADPDGPRRTQLATYQRMIEATALMQQPEATEEGLRLASRQGLLDVLWLEHCPLFAQFAGETWMIDVRRDIRERARTVLAAFRAAGG